MTDARPDPELDAADLPGRRQRVRNATVAEIKRLAWDQIATGGPAALSLRALSRQMGMTGSAIYRYFSGREALLTALITDGFASLADALEAAEAGLDDEVDAAERWLGTARAYRSWAKAHPTEYALIFGTRSPHVEDPGEAVQRQHRRGVDVLFRVMQSCVAEGRADLAEQEATLTPALRAQLEAWRRGDALDLPAAALAGCMTAWTQLHGMLSLELFGGFPPWLQPLDELFDQQMRHVVARIGVRTG